MAGCASTGDDWNVGLVCCNGRPKVCLGRCLYKPQVPTWECGLQLVRPWACGPTSAFLQYITPLETETLSWQITTPSRRKRCTLVLLWLLALPSLDKGCSFPVNCCPQ